MKPYFHEYRSLRSLAAGVTEHRMRSWYLAYPEPPGREDQSPEWLQWAALLELEWDSMHDQFMEDRLRELHHGRT